MTDEDADPNSPPDEDDVSLLDKLANAPSEPAPEGTTALRMHTFLAVAMAKHREGPACGSRADVSASVALAA
jgi:hypothetical protein